MVAPSDTGALVRSLVRVPGSGSDSSAGSVCCDLARASTLAASVPVNPTLPAALTSNRPSQQSVAAKSPHQNHANKMRECTNAGLAAKRVLEANVKVRSPVTATPTNSTSSKRPCPQEFVRTRMTGSANSRSSGQGETQENFQAKRARIVYVTPQLVAEHANIIQGPLPTGTISVHVPQNKNAPVMSPTTIAQLLQERNSLRQENQVLQQHLSLFHQLFRNKEKLTSVVKQLGINVV